MTKTVFAFVLIIIFVGIGIWLFDRKSADISEESQVLMTSTPVPTPTNTLIKMENGLQIQDLTVGTGPEVKVGQELTMHYSGTLENGVKFDSSYDRGEPFQFLLGAGQVIQGWDLGIQGMKIGGKRKLIIPASLGYGEKGIGPIPPNAVLIFEVELLDAQDSQ
ncbi:MAG: peptidylprolyl isomerase [Candidatus Yanofskybacteria bacterium CG10_big_fil_rev_8_21_14_0_10_37_15]|uniref:Peptidyl-prolyl cis-trans isomerase n=1 Tax=Candidatus Yanofskybacteria bacterium CG10_big_fil_rev_8_21_14_0_10_37_15 TaxID=1975097 RepID=A0A2H0R6I4_9BACT|nr:MAG: peptidylprolyl isomerase [Candidatus Yanofskybacteria bacterium CG10_big_fil_rev_8_21_14_0_10_37_15]